MQDRVIAALKTVLDPDVGVNIVDLGLVQNLDIGDDHVVVDLIMTSPACPQGDYLVDQSIIALTSVLSPSVAVDVDIVDYPEWEPSRMSDAAKQQLGWGK